jgi:hypothetical protein
MSFRGSMYLWFYTALLLDLGKFFSFLIFYTVGRTPWTGDQPVVRPLPEHRTPQTQNRGTQISMPQVCFEPTIPVFERTKTVHALDRAAIVIGFSDKLVEKKISILSKAKRTWQTEYCELHGDSRLWETKKSSSVSQIPCHIWNPRVYYRVHMKPSPETVLDMAEWINWWKDMR